MTLFQRCGCYASVIGLGLAAATGVHAQISTIDSAVINTRIFNDDPGSTLNTVNSYPGLVSISDTPTGVGFANLHNFQLAVGGTAYSFGNNEAFLFSADLTISGAGNGEAGLLLSPWWSPNIDGRFNFRTTDGEIAAFGGRLPFYSFTASQGVTYTKGDTVRVGLDYYPNSLSPGDPATITYNLTIGANFYTSGPLAFDEGNPAEGYGSWGHLDNARLGGYLQVFTGMSGAGNELTAQWENISIIPEPSTFALLGLGILPLALRLHRRRAHSAR
jgi:hypothetical protein